MQDPIGQQQAEEQDKTKLLGKLLRDRCSPLAEDDSEKIMAQIEKMLVRTTGPIETTQSFLQEVANTVARMFDFSELAIAIKDRSDNLYKYAVFVGMRKEAEVAYRKIGYSIDEVTSPVKFPRIKLDNYVDFFQGEFRPQREGELETFNRPSQLGKERGTLDDLQEGDYFCIYFYGLSRDILGWFELARTMNGKIPTRQTLKWLELIASVVGRIVYEKDYLNPRR